ncbi:MAG TPA: DUF2269 domain-containing protein [Usitatibacter sp.]|nr:DUF2269 domain-containing protein [Usitatibacter sp.]
MAETYLAVKWLHIVSATLLFGTGLGTAFHFWHTCRGGNVDAIAAAARTTVVADFVFTLPAAIVQPVTGIALAMLAGYPLGSRWIVAAIALYAIAGACWIPVVFIQLRLRDLAAAHAREASAPGSEFNRLFRRWFILGWPAFISMLLILWLMVSRPS